MATYQVFKPSGPAVPIAGTTDIQMRFSLAGTVEAPTMPLAVNLARARFGPGVVLSEVLVPVAGLHIYDVFLMEPDERGFARIGHVQASDPEQAERAAIQWYGPEAIILPPKESP